jgi:isoleucyl-tRNA synthetase
MDFPRMEEEILAFWEREGIFKKSIETRQGADEFIFFDGPPFATGLPHFGHFVPSTVKDIIPRYKTMRGYRVERRFGWDCHGLPVEYEMEKELGISGKREIERFGVAKFNESCRGIVLRYTKEWRRVITRLGRWVDFDNDYKTMDPDYMESIWWVVKSLWDKGLVYEGHYILPYCPRCSTVLSNHELNLGGYKDVHDPAITVRFKIRGEDSAYVLAWTTTPWTLPSNLALCAGPDVDYVMLRDGEERYIMAEARVPAYYKDASEYEILWRKKGSELEGLEYEALFPYFERHRELGAFRLRLGDFVSTEDGTGIVHIAPGFGEDDYAVLKGTGVPVECPVDEECRFTQAVADYAGTFVKDADKAIIERLKAEGKLARREQILHAYPHCWRCSSPLIYRAVSSWFVKIEPVKKAMLEANAGIHWQPAHIRTGRFGKWLENARDWAISRNRYWGNPLPIWKCASCGEAICVGSREELKRLSGKEPEDLHKHFIDDIEIPCSCGAPMRRIPEVLDCWFESGSMPYAQSHYPFENKERFERNFPAHFISESLDQTRGWFYTLTILAAALFEGPAFKNCIVSGLVLAADGQKMSKSKRNYTDPMEVINRYGADAMRLCLMHSSIVKAEDLRFDDELVREVLKGILIPLWNSYSFFVTYANIDGIRAADPAPGPENPLDRWILSLCEKTVAEVVEALEDYDLSRAIDPIVEFIDSLNNWYIRRSRRRFWRSENDADKKGAYDCLGRVLSRLARLAAPFIPFMAEELYRNLKADGEPESVHLSRYPEYDPAYRDEGLEWKMSLVRKAVGIGRALRYQFNLKIRQPLRSVILVTRVQAERAVLLEMEDILREELNVKEVVFKDDEEDLVEYRAKANFRVLGKELGKDMKEAAEKITSLSQSEIAGLLGGSVLSLEIGGRPVELTVDKIEVQRIEKEHLKVQNEGSLTLGLDTEVSPELRMEGDARDLVRGIQNLRKESGLDVTDRIRLWVHGGARLEAAFHAFQDFVIAETLAVEATWSREAHMEKVEADDEAWLVKIAKA